MKKLVLLTALIALVALTVSFARADEELRLPENVHLLSWNGEPIEGTVFKESKETYYVIWGKKPLLDLREVLDKTYIWVTITCQVSYIHESPIYEDYTYTYTLSDADRAGGKTWWDVIENKKIPFPEGVVHIREMICLGGVRGPSVDLPAKPVSNLKTNFE